MPLCQRSELLESLVVEQVNGGHGHEDRGQTATPVEGVKGVGQGEERVYVRWDPVVEPEVPGEEWVGGVGGVVPVQVDGRHGQRGIGLVGQELKQAKRMVQYSNFM